MDIASVFTALIAGLAGVSPIVYLSLIAVFGIGYFYWQERSAFNAERAAQALRYDDMVKAKDQRFDEHRASTQMALDEAYERLSALNAQYSTSNKESAEIIARIAEALQTVAKTLTGASADEFSDDGDHRPRRRGPGR